MDNSNQKASQDMDNFNKKTRKESWEAPPKVVSRAREEAEAPDPSTSVSYFSNPSPSKTNEPSTKGGASQDVWEAVRLRRLENIRKLEMTDPELSQKMREWEAQSKPTQSKPRGVMKLLRNFYFRFFTTILFLVLLSYLITFRLVITIIAIGVMTPQIPMRYYNVVVDIAHESGVFVDYGQAKRFVFRFTWNSIFLYLLFNGWCINFYFGAFILFLYIFYLLNIIFRDLK